MSTRAISASLLLAGAISTAHAGVIAVAPGPRRANIDFHNVPGPCTGDARLAVFTINGADPVLGCYLATEMAVRIAFLDGDVLTLPISALKKPNPV